MLAVEMQPQLCTMLDLSIRTSGYGDRVDLRCVALWDTPDVDLAYSPRVGNLGATPVSGAGAGAGAGRGSPSGVQTGERTCLPELGIEVVVRRRVHASPFV